MTSPTVLVLGAGFTKAFFPDMPLLRDGQIVPHLKQLAEHLPTASTVLNAELRMCGDGTVDIERLMTRLDSGVPYDLPGREAAELAVLLSELKTRFAARIQSAKGPQSRQLLALAGVIVRDGITCLTFNYDDVLDQYLYSVRNGGEGNNETDYWDPEAGYGFPFSDVSAGGATSERHSDACLLKLHGSINWRVRLGYAAPYPLDAIVGLQDWYPWWGSADERQRLHEPTLEQEPLIVPPVLWKTELQRQPLFRIVWSRALEALKDAEQVILVGYSLPPTDVATRSLLAEAVSRDAEIVVVTRGQTEERRMATQQSYRTLWPRLSDDAFRFEDARDWAREFVLSRPDQGPTWHTSFRLAHGLDGTEV